VRVGTSSHPAPAAQPSVVRRTRKARQDGRPPDRRTQRLNRTFMENFRTPAHTTKIKTRVVTRRHSWGPEGGCGRRRRSSSAAVRRTTSKSDGARNEKWAIGPEVPRAGGGRINVSPSAVTKKAQIQATAASVRLERTWPRPGSEKEARHIRTWNMRTSFGVNTAVHCSTAWTDAPESVVPQGSGAAEHRA